MIGDYKKPSVNSKEHEWILCDFGVPSYGHKGDSVELYRQYRNVRSEGWNRYVGSVGWTDHYRLKVNGKWIRKTFFGETAWMDVERYTRDEYGVEVTA